MRQAKTFNPDAEIILIGDQTNDRFPFVRHFRIKGYFNCSIYYYIYIIGLTVLGKRFCDWLIVVLKKSLVQPRDYNWL